MIMILLLTGKFIDKREKNKMRLIKREKDRLSEDDFIFETEIKTNPNFHSISQLYDIMFADKTHHYNYPLLFLSEKPYGILCASCAKKAFILENNNTISTDIYYEGEILYCDNCNAEIESAYGDPYAEDN